MFIMCFSYKTCLIDLGIKDGKSVPCTGRPNCVEGDKLIDEAATLQSQRKKSKFINKKKLFIKDHLLVL